MNKRALLIALIVAVLGAFLLVIYMRRFEQEASGGERILVLMAVKPLDPGAVITEDSVTSREIPLAYVEDRAVKAVEKSNVIGLKLGNKVEAQQTLMWTDLAIATDEQRDLSALIQPGNRAISIRAERNDKSFALIRPGDYVDVIANMPAGDGDKRNAVVLLQRVLCLAVGLQTAPANLVDDKGAYSKDLILTLSVNLQEAQLLSLASEKGQLMVALRNPDDPRVVEGIPDMSSTALEDKDIRGKIQKIRSNAPVKLEAQ